MNPVIIFVLLLVSNRIVTHYNMDIYIDLGITLTYLYFHHPNTYTFIPVEIEVS